MSNEYSQALSRVFHLRPDVEQWSRALCDLYSLFDTVPKEGGRCCELDFVRDLFPITGGVGGGCGDGIGLGQLDAPIGDTVGLAEDAGGFAVHGNGFHDAVVMGGAPDMEPVACFVDARDDGAGRKVVHGMEQLGEVNVAHLGHE